MRTRLDMETELLARLQVANNSTMFPSARLTQLIKDAYIWATTKWIWTDLVNGKHTSTVANNEYYDYPEDFRSNTIMRLTVDNVSYDRKNFEDYLAFKERNPSDQYKMFASYGRYYFIHPTPTANGVNNITVWGALKADSLTNATDITIFTDNKEEGNEALVRKALSVALVRIDKNLSTAEETAANEILQKLNFDELAATQRDQRIQHPKFLVPDFYAGRYKTSYGNFNFEDVL
jgi:hypothetical protein